jgi:hypothetical protein
MLAEKVVVRNGDFRLVVVVLAYLYNIRTRWIKYLLACCIKCFRVLDSAGQVVPNGRVYLS